MRISSLLPASVLETLAKVAAPVATPKVPKAAPAVKGRGPVVGGMTPERWAELGAIRTQFLVENAVEAFSKFLASGGRDIAAEKAAESAKREEVRRLARAERASQRAERIRLAKERAGRILRHWLSVAKKHVRAIGQIPAGILKSIGISEGKVWEALHLIIAGKEDTEKWLLNRVAKSLLV